MPRYLRRAAEPQGMLDHMNTLLRQLGTLLAAMCILSGCASSPDAARPGPAPAIEINLVALNDFHGNLEPSKFSYTPKPDAPSVSVLAGGITTLAGALQQWRREDSDLLFVAAGDLVGGTPAMSAIWADEPSITALDLIGLLASSAGNHEFDHGRKELLRHQHGGCDSPRPHKACKFTPTWPGAKFTWLAANVIDKASGKPLLPSYRIDEVRGVKVALIGAVLKATPSVVLASGIAGLEFLDEADAINAALLEARAKGATVFVVLIHEGAHTDEGFSEPNCRNLQGPVVDIAKRLDPAIRLIISGHTHTGFQCRVGERVITQAEMGGHVLSRIKLSVDPATRTVRDIGVNNVLMTPGAYPPVPAVEAFMQQVRSRSAELLARPIARVGARSIIRKFDPSGEAPLGDLAADAVLAATRHLGVQIGFMNIAGLRRDIDVGPDSVVTYALAQAVLPFGNTLIAMDLSGAQLRRLLEQQWPDGGPEPTRSMLQISEGFSYRWDGSRPAGQRVIRDSVMLNGAPIEDGRTYRVAANNFLAEGGDKLTMFKEGTNRHITDILDLDAFSQYLREREQAGKPAGSATSAGRIVRVR